MGGVVERRDNRRAAVAACALVAALALAGLMPVMAVRATAQPAGPPSLGVSPPSISLGSVVPGEMTDFQVTVFNAGEGVLNVEVGVLDFAKDENGNLMPLPPGQHPFFAMSAWVEVLSPLSFSLQGGEQRQVHFRVTVPASVEPGERSMAVSFTTTSLAEGNIIVSNQVLTQVFALSGTAPVVSAEVDQPSFRKAGTFSPDLQYDVTVRDTGNTHLLLDDIKLRFYRGGRVAHEVSLPALLVLPEIPGQSPGYRIFSGDVSLPQAWAAYDARVEIPSLGVVSESTRVSVFPLWWLLVFIGGGILAYLAFCVLLLAGAASRHRRALERSGCVGVLLHDAESPVSSQRAM